MKIAYIRGDFLSAWEIANSMYLAKNHDFTLFLGKKPVSNVSIPPTMKVVSLWSPADLNFGRVRRFRMGILNRIFVDAHLLFGLEEKLKGFDVAYVSETFYGFTHQALEAKKKGFVKSVVSHASENSAFNNESIRGRKEFKVQVMKEMDKFVAITDGAREVLIQEGCDPKKIVRLQPGVDLTQFNPAPQKHKGIRLLFNGRLTKEKGILQVMEKFAKFSKRFPNLELNILGRGELQPEVENFCMLQKNAKLLGHVPYEKLPEIYNTSDIYLHYSIGSPTWVEQYGFSLIEAMACGLPIIGLDRGSVKEVVQNAGLVVSEENFDAMLEKLIVDSSLRKTFSQKAVLRAKKRYNAETHGKDLEKIFKATT